MPAAAATETIAVSEGVRGLALVAEDNAVNQQVIVRMLEKRGYQVDVATTGAGGGGGVTHRLRPDLHGLSDARDGRLRRHGAIRAHERVSGRRTPIIALTANALASTAAICVAAGMDDYIAKPITTTDLNRVLAQWHTAEPPSVIDGMTAMGQPLDQVLDATVLATLRALGDEEHPHMLAELIALYMRDAPVRLAALHEAIVRADAPAVGLRRTA